MKIKKPECFEDMLELQKISDEIFAECKHKKTGENIDDSVLSLEK